jgi:hypothetical protein
MEPDLKRQWANKHLQLLKVEIDHFCHNNSYTVEAEEDLQAGKYVIKITHPNLFNAIHAVLTLGDFVSTLRTCLDYLICQLVAQNGFQPGGRTCFPICSAWNHANRRSLNEATLGMSDPAKSVVQALQPYNLGENYKQSHLWRLGTLCNLQKHRQITAFKTDPPWQFRTNQYDTAGDDLITTEQVGNCSIVCLPLAAKEHVEFNPQGTEVGLRFIDNKAEIDLEYQDLVEMYEFVANDVLPAFLSFFPDPCVSWAPR